MSQIFQEDILLNDKELGLLRAYGIANRCKYHKSLRILKECFEDQNNQSLVNNGLLIEDKDDDIFYNCKHVYYLTKKGDFVVRKILGEELIGGVI